MYFCLYTPDLLSSNIVCLSLNVRNISCALVFMLPRLCLRAVVKGFLLTKDIFILLSACLLFHWHPRTLFGHRCLNLYVQDLSTKPVRIVEKGCFFFFFPFHFRGLLDVVIRKNSAKRAILKQKHQDNFCDLCVINTVDMMFAVLYDLIKCV